MDSYSYADVIERLFREFGGAMPLPAIVEVTNRCRQQLGEAPATAMPELLECLARQCLANGLAAPAAPRAVTVRL